MACQWLLGVSAFILRYRVPKKRKDAFEDIQRAVRIVRSRAAEWNIDPSRIGVMGSSAGGHLAARVSTGFDIQTYQAVVMISLEDYEAMEETTYLLRSPKNAKRLLESIDQLEQGKGKERELID